MSDDVRDRLTECGIDADATLRDAARMMAWRNSNTRASGAISHDRCSICRSLPISPVSMSDPETPGVYEDRPVPASGRLISSTPIDRCYLCRSPATVHLPPQLGASALCRVCADRIRAELTPPDEAALRALSALRDRPYPVPRCTCEECRR